LTPMKRLFEVDLVLCLCLGVVLCTLVLPSCNTPSNVKEVTPEKLKAMMAGGAPLLVIDTRAVYEFEHGRIPGALHIPQERFPSLPAVLPKDKETTLVFYCRGYG
jgi:predicted sulfurtransferase